MGSSGRAGAGWGFLRAGDCTQKPMAAHCGVSAGRRWCMMTATDRIIRWSTALAVVGVAAVAAVVSYEHAYDLVRAHGETGWSRPDRCCCGRVASGHTGWFIRAAHTDYPS